jgi:hypothetical protein
MRINNRLMELEIEINEGDDLTCLEVGADSSGTGEGAGKGKRPLKSD